VRVLQQELRRLEAVSEAVTRSKQVGLEKANFVSEQLQLAQTATYVIEDQIEEQRNNRPAIHLTPDYIRLTQQIQIMNHYELIDRYVHVHPSIHPSFVIPKQIGVQLMD
jgi:hypothetical protein